MPADDLFDLTGRVALVTGASSGIGRAMALALAGAGASLVLVARNRTELDATRAAIERAGGRGAVAPCDLADRKAVKALAARATEWFGAPDILVCAAGVNLRAPLLEVSEEAWDATMRINLEAPFFLAQALAPAMIAKGYGRIINIASLQSVRAFADSAPYGASKGAIAQLTRAQAQAWSRHGVNANAIAPGFFATALTAPIANDPVRWAEMAKRSFAGRNGELEDLRGTTLFLASRASDFVTGQVLFVDGGFSAG
ncbi:MAG TPA: SDR family oxidoreductase [Casimicrobiaceae bacterium]|nr:SDR family oxidoreductase [Casimicrobiaceae bacterium]